MFIIYFKTAVFKKIAMLLKNGFHPIELWGVLQDPAKLVANYHNIDHDVHFMPAFWLQGLT